MIHRLRVKITESLSGSVCISVKYCLAYEKWRKIRLSLGRQEIFLIRLEDRIELFGEPIKESMAYFSDFGLQFGQSW